MQVHYQFFKTDQSRVGGFVDYNHNIGVTQNMYIMLCGCVTPNQQRIVQARAQIDAEEYTNLLNYIINKAVNPGYREMPKPNNFPCPVFVVETEIENNIYQEVHRDVKGTYQGGTYFFSTAQDILEKYPCMAIVGSLQWH